MTIHAKYKLLIFLIAPTISLLGWFGSIIVGKFIFGTQYDNTGILVVFIIAIVPIYIMLVIIFRKIYLRKLQELSDDKSNIS